MKKIIVGAVLVVGAIVALRRFAPELHERAMRKCQEMMSHHGCSPGGQDDARTAPEGVSADEIFADAQRK